MQIKLLPHDCFLEEGTATRYIQVSFLLPVTLPWVMSPKLTESLSSFIFQTTSLSINYIFCKPYIIFQTHMTSALYANLRTLPMPMLYFYFDLSRLQLSTPKISWVGRRKWAFLSFGQGAVSEEYECIAIGKWLVWLLFLSRKSIESMLWSFCSVVFHTIV